MSLLNQASPFSFDFSLPVSSPFPQSSSPADAHAKVGSDPVLDTLSLKAMWEALGDKVSLRADANQSYTPKEVIKMCQLSQKRALTNGILRYLSQ